MELNAEQIKRALECCLVESNCTGCPLRHYYETDCLKYAGEKALSLIKELTEEKKKLELTLEGVMHFVDKWLDGKELEIDEVNRAATMREKTLQIVEKLIEENERLRGFNSAKCEDCAGCIADKCDCANIEAYAVEKYKSAIIEYYSKPKYQPTKEHPIKHTQIEHLFAVLDQIAKEIENE